MYHVKILTIGKTKEPYLQQALQEYTKRLQKDVKIEWELAKKGENFLRLAKKHKNYICLEQKGLELSSLEFAYFIKNNFEKNGAKTIFIIGGSKGLPKEVQVGATNCLSLSKLTFTHQMARLFLLEQLYRSIQIWKKTSYHK